MDAKWGIPLNKSTELHHFIGKKVRVIRTKKGMTLEDLARTSGLNDKYIGAIERGESNILVVTLFYLASGLNISPEIILEDAIKELHPIGIKEE